jgi:hypothetical protein
MSNEPTEPEASTKPETPQRNDNLLTIPEFAAYWNISESGVVKLIRRGMPSIKAPILGRRILKAQADAWLLAGGANRILKRKPR